jgi:hypothetical protein
MRECGKHPHLQILHSSISHCEGGQPDERHLFGLVALMLAGAASWRAGIPTRRVGVALSLAGLLIIAPLGLAAVTGVAREAATIALFATWTALFSVVGIAIKRDERSGG